MSVELREEAGGKVLILNLSGKLVKEDYAHFTPEVERAVKAHGKVRMLVRMHDFHGWTLGAVWEDTKFGLHHFSHIERLAIVGETRWEAGMAVFCKPFTTAKVRYFDESKADEVATWIHEGIAQTTPAT
ncbi:MAG: STAS/SEC14 domain-containing protein [Betaproteobacteria bacterium]